MSDTSFSNAKLENSLQKAAFDVVEAERQGSCKLLFNSVVRFGRASQPGSWGRRAD